MKTALIRWMAIGISAALAVPGWAQPPLPTMWQCRTFQQSIPCDATDLANQNWADLLNWNNGLPFQPMQDVIVNRTRGGSSIVNYAQTAAPGVSFNMLDVYEVGIRHSLGDSLSTNLLLLRGGPAGASYSLTNGSVNVMGVASIEAGTINHPSEFTQDNGSVSIGNLILGEHAGNTGNYVMTLSNTGGALTVQGSTIVGKGGEGFIRQSNGTHTNHGMVLGQQAWSNGSYNQEGGDLNVIGSLIVGDLGSGTFQTHGSASIPGHTAGHLSANELILGNQSGSSGKFSLYESGSVTTDSTVVGAQGSGTFIQYTGTTHTTGTLQIGTSTGGASTYTLLGGALDAVNAFVNAHGTVNFSGGSITLTQPFDPNCPLCLRTPGTLTVAPGGSVNVKGAAASGLDFYGVVDNQGTFKISGTIISWHGAVWNGNAYISDPSTNIFNSDLIVTTNGYLVGGTGDIFEMHQGFLNSSTNAAMWNTSLAELDFVGSGDHLFGVSGDGSSEAFAWGKIMAGAGVRLSFFDSTPGISGMVLWLDVLDLADGLNAILLDPGELLTIHFDPNNPGNQWLVDLGYGNGVLTLASTLPPGVPEPSTLALLSLCLAGLAAARRRGQ